MTQCSPHPNDPDAETWDPTKPKLEVRLSLKAQISSILDTAERCSDIVEDVDAIPGSGEMPALLGIRTVAQQQSDRLKNIAANIMHDHSMEGDYLSALSR
jgi:hypothetical protein